MGSKRPRQRHRRVRKDETTIAGWPLGLTVGRELAAVLGLPVILWFQLFFFRVDQRVLRRGKAAAARDVVCVGSPPVR